MAQVYVRQTPPVRSPGPNRGLLLAVPVLLAVVAAMAYALTGNLPGVPPLTGTPAAASSPSPALSADPARVDFTDVPTGRRGEPVTVTISNDGGADAHLAGLVLDGPDRGDVVITTSTCWQETLPPGDRCTVHVAFTPTGPGRRSAALTIVGAAGESGVSVSLQGNGIGAAPTTLATAGGQPGGTPGTVGNAAGGRHAVVWLGAQSRTVEATSTAGAAVPYRVSPTVDGVATAASCTPLAATFPLGTTEVTCTVETGDGTVSTAFDVTVRDTTAPKFSLPSDVVIGSDTYTYAKVTALDTVDGTVTATCTPGSPVTLKPLLPTRISCRATDRAGNAAQASYNVVYVFKLPTILINPPSPTPSTS